MHPWSGGQANIITLDVKMATEHYVTAIRDQPVFLDQEHLDTFYNQFIVQPPLEQRLLRPATGTVWELGQRLHSNDPTTVLYEVRNTTGNLTYREAIENRYHRTLEAVTTAALRSYLANKILSALSYFYVLHENGRIVFLEPVIAHRGLARGVVERVLPESHTHASFFNVNMREAPFDSVNELARFSNYLRQFGLSLDTFEEYYLDPRTNIFYMKGGQIWSEQFREGSVVGNMSILYRDILSGRIRAHADASESMDTSSDERSMSSEPYS